MRGRLIAFLDSDCVPEPEWLEEITRPFSEAAIAAVTGVVEEDRPRNIYEMALWGMNRVHGNGEAPRLVAGNLCVRRDWLERFPFDEDLKYGCDEEGLYLKLRAAGARQVVALKARVTHEHRHDGRGFFQLAWVGGKAAAWLVYKYGLFPRLDVVPLLLAYLTLPLALMGMAWLIIPALFLILQLVALAFNDVARKRKSIAAALATLPLLLLFYHVRLAAYLITSARLRLGKNHAVVRGSLSVIRTQSMSEARAQQREAD